MLKKINSLSKLAIVLFLFSSFGCSLGEKKKEKINIAYDVRLDDYEKEKLLYENSNDNFEASFSLGLFYYKDINDYAMAEIWYLRAWKIKKDDKTANNLGYLYQKMEKDDEAIRWYKKAVNIESNMGAYNLAILYEEKLNDINNSIKYYKIAHNLGQKDAASNLGLLYQKKLNNTNLAILWYKKGIKKNSTLALRNIASLYHKKGENEKAVAYLLSMISINPVYTKQLIIKYMKKNWKIDDAVIENGYKLQHDMDDIIHKYEGGL